MIRNFYRETEHLTPYEEQVVLPKVVEIMENRKGFSHAITSKNILTLYGASDKESSARVRKVINYIRNKSIIPCLIATSKGYYIATEAKEITDYEDSLRGRVSAIHKMRQSIHKQGLELFGEEVMKTADEETRNDRKEAEKKYKLSLKVKRDKKKKRKPVLRLKPRKNH